MGELTTTSKPNSAHLVQAALHEAKAAVYGVGALGAGVVTMATLPLTRLATWTEYLFGKYRGGNAPLWNHYLARACTVPTDIAARAALHFLGLRQAEHEKSEMVYAPAAEWPRIFGDDVETWSQGYDVVRNECLEMKMMLPERAYVYQGPLLQAPVTDENGVQIVPAASMTANLVDMISRQIGELQEKWEAYMASRHAPEIVIRPAAAFADPLPMAIQEKAAPKVIETVEEEGRWISAPPVVIPEVAEEKQQAAAAQQTALVVVNAPVAKVAPKPFLKTFTTTLSATLDRKTAKLKTRIGEAVRAAKARRAEKRRLLAEAPLVPALKLIPVTEAPKALEAPKADETVIILPPPAAEEEPAAETLPSFLQPAAEEVKEEVKAEEPKAEEEKTQEEKTEEQAFVPSFLQFDAPAAQEETSQEKPAEEPAPQTEEAAAEEVVAEEVVAEEVVAEEAAAEEVVAGEQAFVPSFLQFDLPADEAVAEAFPVEEIKIEEIRAEEPAAQEAKAEPEPEPEPQPAPAATLSLDPQVTDITPAMLRRALDEKAKAAERALAAMLSLQVTDITPGMLKNATPVKTEAPAVAVEAQTETETETKTKTKTEAEPAPIVLEETHVAVEASLPSFLKFDEPTPAAVAAEKPAPKQDDEADMAARAAAFLFPPSVAAEISLQPALLPEATAPKKRIGRFYNFAANDDRTSKLPPIMSLPRGVIASHR